MLRIFAQFSPESPKGDLRSRAVTALLLTLTVLIGLSFSGIAYANQTNPDQNLNANHHPRTSASQSKSTKHPITSVLGKPLAAPSLGKSQGKAHPATGLTGSFTNFQFVPSYGASIPVTTGDALDGIAVDSYGNVYISNYGDGNVYLETPIATGGYTQSIVGNVPSPGGPVGIAVDNSGNVFVAGDFTGFVYEFSPISGGGYAAPVTIGTALEAPWGVVVDVYGDLFVTDQDAGTVFMETPNGSGGYTESQVDGGFWDEPLGIGIDSSANLYISDGGSDTVYFVANYGGGSFGAPVDISDDYSYPTAVTVGAGGTVYVTDADYGAIVSLYPANGYYAPALVTETLNEPEGVAIDTLGNLYVSDYYTGIVSQFNSNVGAVYASEVNNPNTNVTANFSISGTGTLGTAVVTTQGQTAPSFVNVGGTTDTCSAAAFTGSGTCSVTVSFAPGTPGTFTGGISLADNAGNFVASSTSFTGIGIAPRASFFPGTWSYITNGNTETGDAKSGFAKRRQAAHLKVPKTPEVQPDFMGTLTNYPGDSPNGIVVDQNGNYFVADDDTYNDCAIYAYFPAAPAPNDWISLPMDTGLCPSGGLAVDGSGNVFFSAWWTTDNGAVVAYDLNLGFDATTGMNDYSTPIPAVLYTNTGSFIPYYINNIAVDAYDNVYFTGSDDSYTDAYAFVAPVQSFINNTEPQWIYVNRLPNAFDYLTGIAADNYGDIALTDYDLGQVFVEFPESNGTYSQYTIARGLDTPVAVQWTPVGGIYGGLYVVDSGDDTGVSAVYLYSYNGLYTNLSEGFTLTPLAISPWYEGGGAYFSGFSNDPSGNLWLTDDGFLGGLITEINVNTPPSLNFATTDVGLVSTDSPQTVFLADTGNDTLVLPVPSSGFNPSISPNFLLNSSSFSYAPGGTTPVPDCPLISSSSADGAYIYPDTPCALPVSFAPLMAGPITGTLVVTDNSLYGSSAVPLAKGAKPAIKGISSVRMARGKLAKGLQEPTSTPVSQTINLTGIGVDYFSITFTVTGSPVPPVVKAGGSLSLSFTVAPTAPATYFPLPVVMSAGGGPDGTSYVFNPAVVPAGSGSTTVVLTLNIPIQYVARNEAPAAPGQNGGTKLPVAPLALALLLLPMAGKLRKAGKRMNRLAAMLLLAIAGLTATATLIGCGANKAAVYYITVTGTSGALSNSTSFDITVQGR